VRFILLCFILLKAHLFLEVKKNVSANGEHNSAKKKVSTAGTRERRPSDKVAEQHLFFSLHVFNVVDIYFSVDAQRAAAKAKAEAEERRALRKKKALQKANQQAGKETGSEDDFQPRANPSVHFFSFFKPYLLNLLVVHLP
jgi:hypothetical protein